MKLDIFGKVKQGLQILDVVKKIGKVVDKLGDDLDHNGKSQLQDICEKVESIAVAVFNQSLAILRQFQEVFDYLKLHGGEVVRMGQELADHVLKEEKK